MYAVPNLLTPTPARYFVPLIRLRDRKVKGTFIYLYLRVSDKYNPNRVVFDTTLMACGTTVRVLMPLQFLDSIRLGLGLGL